MSSWGLIIERLTQDDDVQRMHRRHRRLRRKAAQEAASERAGARERPVAPVSSRAGDSAAVKPLGLNGPVTG